MLADRLILLEVALELADVTAAVHGELPAAAALRVAGDATTLQIHLAAPFRLVGRSGGGGWLAIFQHHPASLRMLASAPVDGHEIGAHRA